MIDEVELQRTLDRAGVDTAPVDLHLYAYRDRAGRIHLQRQTITAVAQAFVAAEPYTVTTYLDDEEQEMRLRGNRPGDRFFHDYYMRELAPGHALHDAGPECNRKPISSAPRSAACACCSTAQLTTSPLLARTANPVAYSERSKAADVERPTSAIRGSCAVVALQLRADRVAERGERSS